MRQNHDPFNLPNSAPWHRSPKWVDFTIAMSGEQLEASFHQRQSRISSLCHQPAALDDRTPRASSGFLRWSQFVTSLPITVDGFGREELDPGGEGEVPEAIPDCFLVQIEF
jgi:hypothetical protein